MLVWQGAGFEKCVCVCVCVCVHLCVLADIIGVGRHTIYFILVGTMLRHQSILCGYGARAILGLKTRRNTNLL